MNGGDRGRFRRIGNVTSLGFCSDHQKLLYASKKHAKIIARQHVDHMNVFRCEYIEHLWHVGHLAEPVILGEIDRDSLYREAS